MKFRTVVFTETGEERKVEHNCRRCAIVDPSASEHHFTVISKHGTAHIGVDYGMTACGIDATGPTWWWPE